MPPSTTYAVQLVDILKHGRGQGVFRKQEVTDTLHLLADLADRAKQLDDPVVNNIMLRLGLQETDGVPLTILLDEEAERLR